MLHVMARMLQWDIWNGKKFHSLSHFYLGMHVGRGNGDRSELAVLLCLTLRGQLGGRKRRSRWTERKTPKEKEETKWISFEVTI